MYTWNLNHTTLASWGQRFNFLIDGFVVLQLQENIFQGCPANLIINNPLQKTALEMAEQICTIETTRLSPATKAEFPLNTRRA